MKAMILAAGRGARLRPLTDRIAKPMIPIVGEPLIVHQLRWLRRAGVHEVVVNVCHLGEQIERGLGDGAEHGVRIRYSREDDLLDTGGGVKRALALLGSAPFVVLNGDIWTDYRFENLLDKRPRQAHLVLTPTPPHRPHADFRLDRDRVRRDGPRAAANNLTYCGFGVLSSALFESSPEGAFSLADLYFRAAAAGELTGEVFHGDWVDIGTPAQLERLRSRAGAPRTG